jgi:hypothetical protein
MSNSTGSGYESQLMYISVVGLDVQKFLPAEKTAWPLMLPSVVNPSHLLFVSQLISMAFKAAVELWQKTVVSYFGVLSD